MGRIAKLVGVPVFTLVVGLVAGVAVGQRQGLDMGMGMLVTEVGGSLSMHVETASCVRVGDTDCALRLLDTMIDSAVVSLQSQPADERPQRALGDAKTYRSVVPAAGTRAEAVEAALDDVPAAERRSAETPTTGLGRLVERAGG